MRCAVALTLGALLGGCGSKVDIGLGSSDPQGRTIALARAAERPTDADIPALIAALDSADSAHRLLAINALTRLTGDDFGYRHYDPRWRRDKGVERWVAWWRTQRGGSGGAGSGGGAAVADSAPDTLR